MSTVIPGAFVQTLILLTTVGLLAAVLGTGLAWMVTAYAFPGRRLLEWALLLPLAVPTYIIAYAYLDILHPVGPVQSTLRWVLGYASPRDLRLPDIRSMAGCTILLGFVLYPYVYLATRAMFLTQSASLTDAGRTLGVSKRGLFWHIGLPLARPAIAVGTSLAMMEALNDIGASEFLGVRTLTVSIYSTWVTRSDLPGAAQIALALLIVVIALVSVERWARRRQRYSIGVQRSRPFEPRPIPAKWGLTLLVLGLLPVLIGFVAPAAYLVVEAWKRVRFAGVSSSLAAQTLNTIAIALTATLVTLALGIVVAYAVRLRSGSSANWLFRLSTAGYAAPGTVVAIGVLIVVATIDRSIDQAARQWFGVSTGLLLIGSGTALIYAYSVRFLAISAGAVDAGLARIPVTFDDAARTLGETPAGTVRRIHMPLSAATLAAGGVLIFVDAVKELSATLMLRPLNVETLATFLYAEAARGTYEEGAIAALAIVAVGVLPVIVLSRIGLRPLR